MTNKNDFLDPEAINAIVADCKAIPKHERAASDEWQKKTTFLYSQVDRLIYFLIEQYTRSRQTHNTMYEDRDNMVQAARVGFMKAINDYNPSYNTKFTWYLSRKVLGEIKWVKARERRQRIETPISDLGTDIVNVEDISYNVWKESSRPENQPNYIPDLKDLINQTIERANLTDKQRKIIEDVYYNNVPVKDVRSDITRQGSTYSHRLALKKLRLAYEYVTFID